VEKLVLQAKLGEADDLVGENVHLRDSRAARRALAALITSKKVLAAEFFDLGDKSIFDFSSGYVDSHQKTLIQMIGLEILYSI
jgi:hypothetical protein